jgi:hypothetical protein
MRTILFLDFDGVLHSHGGPLFGRVASLEQFLVQMPKLSVVVSSSWRETQTLTQMQANFSPAIRSRIIGMTPILPWQEQVGHRQREIEEYLRIQQLGADAVSWRALDDIAWFFEPTCANLILVDAKTGFQAQHGAALLKWYVQVHG